MLPLDDPRWQSYTGGYRLPYDASVPLRRLFEEGATPELWDELWQELHHQGNLGPASFAAVPWLLEFARRQPELDWNIFGLVALIDLEREHYCRNRPIPPELADDYYRALARLPEVVGTHPQKEWPPILMQHIAACMALARGQRVMAKAYLELDRDAAKKWLEDEMGWDDEIMKRWAAD